MTNKTDIFLVMPGAGLRRMSPSAPATEDELQGLIAMYPELIGDSDGDLLLIEREHGVADLLDGTPRWSLDHLYVTRNAIPVLVEVKRATDTRLRREVVGQLLDYAANSVAYWPAGTIATRFAAACEARHADPSVELMDFLGPDRDAEAFWAQVDANFRAGSIKLVFVADEIPSELARIVEFLNEQMTADVSAVELRYFEGPDGIRTLAPRVIGQTERTRATKSGTKPKLDPISQEDWIEKHIASRGQKVLEGARALLDVMQRLTEEQGVASTQGSMFCRISTGAGKFAYPFFLLKSGRGQIGFGWLGGAPLLESEEVRHSFYGRFADAVGSLSTKNVKGFPAFPLERLADPQVFAKFVAVAEDFCRACKPVLVEKAVSATSMGASDWTEVGEVLT